MTRLLVIFVVWILGLSLFSARVQPSASGEIILSMDSLHSYSASGYGYHLGYVLSSVPWKYHAGDDSTLLWAQPTFDAAPWSAVLPNFRLSDLPDNIWLGVGWFRLRIVVDSSLQNTMLSLSVRQGGASEIYLDGVLIKRFGSIGGRGASAREVTAHNPLDAPISIYFDSKSSHVIAVRYAIADAQQIAERYQRRGLYLGFSALIATPDESVVEIVKNRTITVIFAVLPLGVLLLLCLLHLMLFLLYSNDRSNLYLALFSAAVACNSFLIYLPTYVHLSKEMLLLLDGLVQIDAGLWYGFLLIALYSLFYKPLPKQAYWVAISLGVLEMSVNFFRPVWLDSLLQIEIVELGITSCVLFFVLLVTFRAVLRRQDGAWIIGIGAVVSTAAMIVNYVLLLVSITRTPLVVFALTASIYLSMPFSLSAFIARRFARTNRSLGEQLEHVQVLSAKALAQEQEKQRIIEGQNAELERLVRERTAQLEDSTHEIQRQLELLSEQALEIGLTNTALQQANEQSERLLLNVLPAPIAKRLKQNETTIADRYEDVTVLFADIVNFIMLSARTTPERLVSGLDDIFTEFDELAKKYGLEKIKTVGDCYMAAGGLLEEGNNTFGDHVQRVAMFALAVQEAMKNKRFTTTSGDSINLRIGIHTGPVIAGVIGTSKFSYDLWGDTVNTASRMESHGEAGKIHVTEEVHHRLTTTHSMDSSHTQHLQFTFEERGVIEIKSKGLMPTWFLTGSIP